MAKGRVALSLQAVIRPKTSARPTPPRTNSNPFTG
jgi:hypothetical protein